MKGVVFMICLVFIISFISPSKALAMTESEAVSEAILKLLVKKGVVSEKEVEVLKAEVKKQTVEAPAAPPRTCTVKCVEAVSIGGVMDVRYEDSQNEQGTFNMKAFYPYVQADFTDRITGKGKLKVMPDNTILDELWVKYKDFPVVSGELTFGKYRRNSFGIAQGDAVDGELLYRAFVDNKQVGLEYSNDFSKFNLPIPWTFSVGICNGGDVTTKELGDNAGSPVLFIADGSGDIDDNNSKEGSARVTCKPFEFLTVGASGLYGKLSPADLSTLNTLLGTSYTDDDKRRYGGDLTLKHTFSEDLSTELRGEYMFGETSDLDAYAWYVIGCVRLLNQKLDLFGRYSELRPDIAANANSETWDLYQTTVGGRWHFTDMTQLQVEYEFNGEDAGAGIDSVKNDMLKIKSTTEF